MENIPVALPPAPQDPLVELPNPPAAPPNTGDIVRAMKYRRDIVNSREQRPLGNKSSDQDLASAATYEHRVLQQASAAAAPLQAAPAWFLPAMQAIIPPMMVPIMVPIITPIMMAITRLTNQLRDNGQIIPYVVVPFADGTDPVVVHGLPALRSHQAIDGLNAQQLIAYLNGYNEPVPVGPDPGAVERLSRDVLKRTVSGRS